MLDAGERSEHKFQQVVIRDGVRQLAEVFLFAQAAGNVVVISETL